MKLEPPWDQRRRPGSDSQALPLINIAFLLLVFFMMAGTLPAPEPFPLDDLRVTRGEAARPVPDRLVVARDGRLAFRGEILTLDELTPARFAGVQGPLPVKVDAQTEARRVVTLLRHLRQSGIDQVQLIGIDAPARPPDTADPTPRGR